MLAKNWLNDHVGSATDAAQARFAAASEVVANNLQDAQHALARHGAAGLDYARTVGSGMRKGSYRLGRSTRSLVAERPVESAIIIGVAAFAIGWLWRRSRELQARSEAPARALPKRRKTA